MLGAREGAIFYILEVRVRYLSLFSGIEAASVAWLPLGWEPLAFSEIDDFPCAVLRHHYPDVPNLGDIRMIDWGELLGTYGRPDLIVGGSPCQSFSLAGKREGLRGESGLMFEYIRAVREVRPRIFLWENVPGALTVERGAAFGQLLAEVDGFGYRLAWRILDSQFFGVPQRRRRVFLVGCLGDLDPAEVLFESEGLRRDYPSSKQKRTALAESVGRGAGGCGGDGAIVLKLRHTGTPNAGGGEGAMWCNGVSYTLATSQDQTLFERVSDGTSRVPSAVALQTGHTNGNGSGINTDGVSYTLSLANDQAVALEDGTSWLVRRFTPIECERLQGFPDGYTDIGAWVDGRGRKRVTSDSNRYKALGNSFAVPVVRWIGERIQSVCDC